MDIRQMSELFLIAFFSYVIVLFLLRLSGKRTLLKMNAFDFIITVSVGAVFGNMLINYKENLFQGLYVIFLLLLFQFFSSLLSSRYTFFDTLLKANPTLLFYEGTYYEAILKKERIPRSEVLQAMREQGIGRIEEVGAVILETDGTISVLPKEKSKENNLDTLQDLDKKSKKRKKDSDDDQFD
ncbi:Protein of unknown function [Alkalibacterium putridalgicola]|uniref:DUF421 domain-containing protein n=1 Tax=Alkalibacterium putridalgicola TaxID=426703 RepID=A0A1H7SHI4_9LACT|nr:YetF domain-containing protein [Alkalibacterium putridalgicola]GEK88738.1 DUF421 domain-containing protein [Alkalibacterium putridalgicola]SEL72082.1 Protein of unknown function [Alkalibacterium putridalgicola]